MAAHNRIEDIAPALELSELPSDVAGGMCAAHFAPALDLQRGAVAPRAVEADPAIAGRFLIVQMWLGAHALDRRHARLLQWS